MAKVGRTTVVCTTCGSERTWKKGSVPNVKGAKQRFMCVDCGHSFYFKKSDKVKEVVEKTEN